MRNIVFIIFIVMIFWGNQTSLRGEDNSSLYEEGKKLFKAGNYVGAVEKLNQALQFESNNKAQIYVGLGKAFLNLKRRDESRRAYEEALKIDSELVSAKLGIAMIEAASGRCDQALSALDKVKDKISERADKEAAYVLQVNCDNADKHRTIEHLNNLINHRGDRAEANDYIALWQLYSQTEQYSRAVDAISKALKINDTAENRQRYGIALYNNGQIEESIVEYKKLIQKNPQVADYHIHLANALTVKEEYEEAKKEILTALSIEPKNAGYHFAKSIVEILMKEYDQCIESAQFAIENGDDEIKAKALFFSGECLYRKGNIEEAVKRYATLAEKYPRSSLATLSKEVTDNINMYKEIDDQHMLKDVPFIKKGANSSLVTAINMVIKFWEKKNELSQKEINTIEFDGREPSMADAWLLLKGKGFESVVTGSDIDILKALIKGMPIIMRESKTSNYFVLTGYDDRRKTFYFNDPKMNNRLGQFTYEGWHKSDDDIFIIMPAIAKDLSLKQETTKELFSALFDATLILASAKLLDEGENGFHVAEKIYQLYPKVYEAKLIMAAKLLLSKNYKKAITCYKELLLNNDISDQVKGLASVGLAASYNKLGDIKNAERYLKKAKEINPEFERNYEQLLKIE